MGLDSFWQCERRVWFWKKPKLSGGLLTGHGKHSFRGGRYTDTVSAVSPYTLYTEELSNEQVREIAAALEANNFQDVMLRVRERGGVELEETEYAEFTRVFKKYALAGARLKGWW